MVDHAREQPDPYATRADISDIRSDMSDIRSEITNLRGEMRAIRDAPDRQIIALRESMERRFAANDQRLDRLQWRIISALIALSAIVVGAIKYL